MPSYVAFLRAINLGPTRKFPKADIVAAVESTGATGVETYINTGNVRLTTTLRSRAKVEATLEAAFAADRGFEVPTIVFTPAELRGVVADVDELWAEHGEPLAHAVTLFKQPPPTDAVAAVESLDLGDRAVVRGRAAHVMLLKNLHESKLLTSKQFAALGQGTARYATVLREVTDRWC
ncbi:MAG: DUF1697 domain-containing protein [Nocardioidaceae bacterium]|nr:DUF1697 domain-containing protein [Nocardioidaceae bacterium]